MDAPSQNMNALSVQSLFFVNDEAMHEIDLKVLAKLPETFRMLQEQVSSLSSSGVASPESSAFGEHVARESEPRGSRETHATAEVVATEEAAPSFTRRARQQQLQQPAAVA